MALDRSGNAIRSDAGRLYENLNIATDDTPRRFEEESKYLEDVIIWVEDKGQYFGTASAQRFPVGAGSSIGFTMVNISTLYFKNQEAGQNGTVHILGVGS